MTDSMGQREEEDVMGARDGAATQGVVPHMIYDAGTHDGGLSFSLVFGLTVEASNLDNP